LLRVVSRLFFFVFYFSSGRDLLKNLFSHSFIVGV